MYAWSPARRNNSIKTVKTNSKGEFHPRKPGLSHTRPFAFSSPFGMKWSQTSWFAKHEGAVCISLTLHHRTSMYPGSCFMPLAAIWRRQHVKPSGAALNGKDSRMNWLIFPYSLSLGSVHHMTTLAELLTLTSVSMGWDLVVSFMWCIKLEDTDGHKVRSFLCKGTKASEVPAVA